MVKIVRPDRLDVRRVREAVLNEGRLLRELTHPHLVRCYEVVEDPVPAAVLETLTGQTLDAVLDQRTLREPDSVEPGLRLSSALSYLHRHGWLHLDVQPDNVVVRGSRATLIDLSLSARPGDGREGAGTPEYMAPEQHTGLGLSAAIDVWGLAQVLVESLTGEIADPGWPAYRLPREGLRRPTLDPAYADLLRSCAPALLPRPGPEPPAFDAAGAAGPVKSSVAPGCTTESAETQRARCACPTIAQSIGSGGLMFRRCAAVCALALGVVGSLLTAPSAGVVAVYGGIYGTVAGPGGSSLQGAFVQAYAFYPSGWQYAGGVETQADGSYSISLHTGYRYRLHMSAEGDGFASEYWGDVDLPEDAAEIALSNAQPTRSGIDAQLDRYASIAGHVTDEAGSPVSGAAVRAYNDRHQLMRGMITGPDGRFVADRLRSGAYRIEIAPEGSELVGEWLDDSKDFTGADPVDLSSGEKVDGIVAELAAPGRIAGTIRSQDGTARGDASVWAVQLIDGQWQVTSSTHSGDGRYVLEGLRAGPHKVGFGVPGYLQEFFGGAATADAATTVDVRAGEEIRGIDASVDPAGAISGRVVADSGAALVGADIVLQQRAGSTWKVISRVTTGADGGYVLEGLGPAAYRVQFGSARYSHHPEFWPGVRAADQATTIVLDRSEQRSGVNGRLAPASVIKGRLTTPSGAPLPGIAVYAYVRTPGGYRDYTATGTERDGRFRVTGLEPGRYRLWFSDQRPGSVYYAGEYWNRKGTGGALSEGADIEVGLSSVRSRVDAQLVRGSTVTGRVVTTSGPAPWGPNLRFYRYRHGRWSPQPLSGSGPFGAFSVRLHPGRYRLAFVGSDHKVAEFWNGAERFGRATEIRLSPGEYLTGLNAVVDNPPAEVITTRQPVLIGRAQVGTTLGVEAGEYEPSGVRVRYQWYAGDRPIPGADAPTLQVTPGLRGRRLSVLVTASKPGLLPLQDLFIAEIVTSQA